MKYLVAPIPALQNLPSASSPSAPRLLKSLIRRQPKQSSNRPSSRLFPHLCAGRRRRRRRSRFTTAPELPHLRPRPPHRVVHRQRRPPHVDVPHRHRVPPHQVRFTDAVSQLTGATSPSTSSHLRPPRLLGLHQRSRPPHRSAPLPLKICNRARPANASASPSTALKWPAL